MDRPVPVGVMAIYGLKKDGKSDLYRNYSGILRKQDEIQAGWHYTTFFDHFEQRAERPLSYPAVDRIPAR